MTPVLQIEWVGWSLPFAVMGPWPKRERHAVYVILLGPLYVSVFPGAFTDAVEWLG